MQDLAHRLVLVTVCAVIVIVRAVIVPDSAR
jgi:hypothetical protein